jgi:hypothetical protein
MLEKIQSDQINELVSALAKAQGEITPAIKDSKNPFFKSSYADLTSVWSCCKDPLSRNGLAVIQTMDVKDGQQILITTLAHASGQWMRSCMPILNEKGNVQGMGAAITYSRRYALSAIIGITCDEDDDGNAAIVQRIKPYQAKELEMLFSQCDPAFAERIETEYFKQFSISKWADLPLEKYQPLVNYIQNHIRSKAA